MDLLCAFSGFGGGAWYKTEKWGWKDWQLLRKLATARSGFGCQHLLRVLQTPVTVVPGAPTLSSDLSKRWAHTSAQTHMQEIFYVYKIINKYLKGTDIRTTVAQGWDL